MPTYEPTIGLEVHAQLLTRSKLFCGCSTRFGAPPNTHVCEVCLGLPGALPVPNSEAIAMAIRAGFALDCDVALESRFARKNYFYPDLSKGYQISQFDQPLNVEGGLTIEVGGATKRIGIQRIHVEEDAAKNLHGASSGTLVDFNRAGTALIEIVSEPDLASADEAETYLRKLRDILMFIGVNDGNLEEGSFRCDANVSIKPVGATKLGTRTELKNINSFKFVKKAIEHEIARQESVIASGGSIVQETRTWSEPQQKTISMRSKEEAHDYRYFPDPDLPVLALDTAMLSAIEAAMPELPEAKRTRYVAELGLTPYDAQVLTGHPRIAEYFEEAATLAAAEFGDRRGEAAKKVANFVQSEVLRYVETDGLSARFPVPASYVAELVVLVQGGTISGKMGKEVFAESATRGKRPVAIVDQKGLAQNSDAGALEAEALRIVEANPDQVKKYREGKTSLLGFFVGQLMKATKGSANPAMVNDVLKKLLEVQA